METVAFKEYPCPAGAFPQKSYTILPDQHTLEAEALGAIIQTLGEGHGSYASTPLYHTLAEAAQDLLSCAKPIDSQRIREYLAMAHELTSQGKFVLYELSGPLSVLNCLLDTNALLRSFRKDKALLDEVLTSFRGALVSYVKLIVASGVKHISIADPICSVYTIGPRAKEAYIKSHILPLLQEIKQATKGAVLIHLCPKLFLDLARTGLCRSKLLEVPAGYTYKQAYDISLGHTDLVGDVCILRTADIVSGGSIETLIIPHAI
ncbi:MAG: hypothetical protein E7241_08190 [Lachnospiraceae bacterium]|nr:hypothetical protein [Lachnospiraceae bacterium]